MKRKSPSHRLGAMLLATAVWLALPGQTSAGVPEDTKALLTNEGAIVLDFGNLPIPTFAAIDCLGSTNPLCANYANTAVTYIGFLYPCPFGMCNPITPPPLGLPLPVGAGFQLGENEAMVIYGHIPPDGAYVGFQTSFNEQEEANVPNPGDREPLRPGERPPPPTTPTRAVVSSAVGDTENTLVLPFAPDPDDPTGFDVFVKIVTGNDEVAQLISDALVASGFPPEAITVKELPASYFLSTGNDADTFREVIRIARPFDPALIDAYLNSNPFQVWRVTDPAAAFSGFPEVTHSVRETGRREIAGTCRIVPKFERFVRNKLGHPDRSLRMVPRTYDDEFCIDTGTYCWGNNNDALYADAREENDDLVQFDVGGVDSKLVITGVDHVAAEYTELWNVDFYDPTTAIAIDTVLSADVQDDDYGPDFDEFCSQNPGNCSCGHRPYVCHQWPAKLCKKFPGLCSHFAEFCRAHYPNRLDGKLYYLQVKQQCDATDAHCKELQTGGGEPVFNIMHRLYLSPETGTGPSPNEASLPKLFSYE